MPHDPYKALYIHVPFCVKRCHYCDFTTRALPADSREIDDYFENLVLEVRRKSKEGELAHIDTVYVGGGTPSHVGMSRLSSLFYALSLSMRLEPDVECTMEVNPESVTGRLVNDVWALGVNRLSLGVQSFDDQVLTILGRAHNAQQAIDAIRLAQQRFENMSIDLMCGIPGQSVESFEKSLNIAVELGIPHISVYPLTIEEHTPFQRMVFAGQLEEPDEDVEAQHMALAQRVLSEAGYHRYEVASYAKPGYECRHNKAYWTGLPYLGIGMAAATMTQNDQRRMRVQDGRVTDDLNPAQMIAEDLMMGMRMACGVSEEMVKDACGLLPTAQETFEELCQLGLCELRDGRYRPTETGWLCGNELYGRIFDMAP